MNAPTIGRIVHYRLNDPDAQKIEQRRLDTRAHQSPGFNAAHCGDVYPAMVVRVWSDTTVNLQVHLDGADTYWRTSATLGDSEDENDTGVWFWPPRVDMTREGR